MERLTNSIDYCQMHCNFGKENDCMFSDKSHCYDNNIYNRLREYEIAEEQGLLLRLPCGFDDTLYWIVNGNIRECWFKGIRCDKGYKPQIIARCLEGLLSKETPIAKLENIGKTVFLTKEEAEQALKQMGE